MIVSPNPSSDIFVVEGGLLTITKSIQVLSVEGKLVEEMLIDDNASLKLNASNWKSGVYFLNLNTVYGNHSIKLIKE